MDKSVIFNLLNTFYDYYKKNTGGSEPKSETQTEETGSSPLNSFLGGLFKKPAAPETPPPKTERVPQAPLQSKMIGTMTRHDEIVSRVMNNNKPK